MGRFSSNIKEVAGKWFKKFPSGVSTLLQLPLGIS